MAADDDEIDLPFPGRSTTRSQTRAPNVSQRNVVTAMPRAATRTSRPRGSSRRMARRARAAVRTTRARSRHHPPARLVCGRDWSGIFMLTDTWILRGEHWKAERSRQRGGRVRDRRPLRSEGRGLGRILLAKLGDYLSARATERVLGYVLRENAEMRRLPRRSASSTTGPGRGRCRHVAAREDTRAAPGDPQKIDPGQGSDLNRENNGRVMETRFCR